MPIRSFIAFIVFIAVTASAHSQNLQIEKVDIPAAFITCMIPDGNGGTYIGTEDNGIFHYTQTGNITQYTTKDKLGDNNAYALSIDNQGRLWAGHLNSGISIFNGSTWKNYNILDGPIGERIFDIETCPTDDDVWIATSAGLTRYKINDDSWQHYTREDGLLEDQASALAFTTNGTLIVGTQCHGLAIFERDNNGNYQHAKNITAPERFGVNNVSPVPLDAMGEGLPSNQINDICIAQDDTIWIATSAGLTKMNEDMTNITYIRGKDYADKVRGLYGGAPASWKECSKEAMQKLLPEDYITCITEDANGALWIGTRRCGFVVANPNTWESTIYDNKTAGLPDNYVTSILLSQNASPMIGTYGGGVVRLKDEIKVQVNTKRMPVKKERRVASRKVAFPNAIKPPTVEELKTMQSTLESLTEPLPKPFAAYLGEDWQTQGDWVGRHGRKLSCLCAASSPFDHFVQHDGPYTRLQAYIGPNSASDDTIRRWVHWLKTDNPKTLYSPWNGYRRQAEWDDHGEAYSITKDGPDLWVYMELKDEDENTFSSIVESKHKLILAEKIETYDRLAPYRISMYFFNKDGHQSNNRYRDYLLEIYECPMAWKGFNRTAFSKASEQITQTQRPLAKARVKNFWGGVHKQFVVMGPGQYLIKIKRNYSFNTIVSSVCLDHFGKWYNLEDEDQSQDFIHGTYLRSHMYEDQPLDLLYDVRVEPLPLPKKVDNALSQEAVHLWNTIDKTAGYTECMKLVNKFRLSAYQAAASAAEGSVPDSAEQRTKESFAWRLYQWNSKERAIFAKKMQEAWRQFGEENPEYVEKQQKLLQQREDGTWKNPWEGWD